VLAAPYAAGLLPNVSVSGGAGDVLAATNTGTGSALRGSSPSGTGVYGLSGRGGAVVGENAGSGPREGCGGYFTSSIGVGVYGGNTAEASTANPSAPGIQGYSLNGYGVLGESASAARAGVAGRSQLGTGVLAESANGVGLEAIGTNGLGLRVRSEAGIAADVESAQGPALVVRSRGTEARDHAGSFTAGNGNAVLAISTGSAAVRAEAGDTLAVPDEVLLAGVIARGKDAGSFSASENGSGVIGTSLGGAGVRGISRTHYGGYFTSQDGRGLYVANLNGRQLDAYFGGETGIEVAASARIDQDLVVYGDTRVYGDLQVSGRRVLNLTLAINAGPAPLRRGDVVEVAGLADAPLDGAPVVLVRRTETVSSHGVVGVVDCAWDPDGGFGAGSTVEIPAGGALGIATLGTFDGVRADASAGAIGIGDLLVSAPTAGHLQRADAPQPGTVVGKALEDLAGGTAQIAVFLTLE